MRIGRYCEVGFAPVNFRLARKPPETADTEGSLSTKRQQALDQVD